jgi:hypothetical protein
MCNDVRCAGGLEGGPLGPPARGFRGSSSKKNVFAIYLEKCVTYLGGFSAHGFLPMVFYFQLRN